ncbi:hypothetical protein TIFTF001_015650 [Ficus carica]|uniref:Uncharacterized protein n=1 Tax=Ficus carica TaxID=3494 RepID=A0AA88DIP4_FICCA|nr:hypothetical protein TIFTF001_015650 [Ficus carica]
MPSFLRKTIFLGSFYARTSRPISINPGFLQNPDFFPLRLFSASSNQETFTVSYLINSIGLSPQIALLASKHVNFEAPEKPDKVIKVFKDYGFTRPQISSLVKSYPPVLLSNTEKTILPKLEFLKSKGLSGPEMAKRLSVYPTLLKCSLDKQIIPSFDFFRDFFRSDKKASVAVKRFPDILVNDVEKIVVPNMNILREYGVSDSNIAKLLVNQPKAFMISSDKLRKIVEKVKEMGFDASKFKFLLAVLSFRAMSTSTWERKVSAYRGCGWSEEDVFSAFHRFPWCMMLSEENIIASVNFFVYELGWRPCLIAKRPIILSMSLEKRVIPRWSVFQALLSKGLVKEEVSLYALLETPEEKFLLKFITPYKKEAPELLKLYREKLKLSNKPPVEKA